MSSSPGSSATVDADDSVSLQVSDVKDSILNESEATVDGSSKRPCGSETKAVSKKIRLTDEEIIDLLMSKVIEAQTVSKNTDIMESSVELPTLSSTSEVSLLKSNEIHTNIFDVTTDSDIEEPSELNLDKPTTQLNKSSQSKYSVATTMSLSSSTTEISLLNSRENHIDFLDLTIDSDIEEPSELDKDKSTSQFDKSSQSAYSITSSVSLSSSTSKITLLNRRENHIDILDLTIDSDIEEPSELDKDESTSQLNRSPLPESSFTSTVSLSSSSISEIPVLNNIENHINIIDITEDTDIEEPSELNKISQLNRSLQPKSSVTPTVQKQLSSPNISELSPLNSTTNSTNTVNITEDCDNEEPSELNRNLLTSSLPSSSQLKPITSTVLRHPAPLPLFSNVTSLESWKKIPPSPTLTIQSLPELSDKNAIELRWNLNVNDEEFAEIAHYEIFNYQQVSSEKPISSLWRKIAEVSAIPLPMFCTMSCVSLKPCKKQYFAVRAVDKYLRLGPFSSIQFIELNQI